MGPFGNGCFTVLAVVVYGRFMLLVVRWFDLLCFLCIGVQCFSCFLVVICSLGLAMAI